MFAGRILELVLLGFEPRFWDTILSSKSHVLDHLDYSTSRRRLQPVPPTFIMCELFRSFFCSILKSIGLLEETIKGNCSLVGIAHLIAAVESLDLRGCLVQRSNRVHI